MGRLKNPVRLSVLLVAFLFCTNLFAEVDFATHGYFRTRGNVYQNLDTQKSRNLAYDNNRVGLMNYNQMRLRLEPMMKIGDFLSIQTQFDVLDNILFGTNQTQQIYIQSPVVGTVSLPEGPGSLSVVGGEAGENKAINVRRVWMDIMTPVGQIRVGRQASHFGLGIFQNDGNEQQADFGDSADRVMFMSGYEFNDDSSITGGVLWDVAYAALQQDPRVSGLASAITENGKNTNQYAGFFIYERPEATVGLFGGLRRRSGGNGYIQTAIPAGSSEYEDPIPAGLDGKTMLYFADLYARYSYEEYDFKFEGVYLGGKMSTGAAINAVPFSVYSGCTVSATNRCGVIDLPTNQDVRVFMAAFEATGAYKWGGEWQVQSGFAQGDATPLSQRITQYGFRPDYSIALLMFHMPLGTSPALVGTPSYNSSITTKLSGNVPITGKNVNNAIYVTAGYKHHFDIKNSVKSCDDLALGAKVITAWADKNPVELNFQQLLNDTNMPIIRNSSKWYGVEADMILETQFYNHFYGSLEGGVLIPGGAYNIKVDEALLGPLIQTIPYSKAVPAYGGRLTLMVNF